MCPAVRTAGCREVGGLGVPRHGHEASDIDEERLGVVALVARVAPSPQEGGVDQLRASVPPRIQLAHEDIDTVEGPAVGAAPKLPKPLRVTDLRDFTFCDVPRRPPWATTHLPPLGLSRPCLFSFADPTVLRRRGTGLLISSSHSIYPPGGRTPAPAGKSQPVGSCCCRANSSPSRCTCTNRRKSFGTAGGDWLDGWIRAKR